MRLLTFLSLLGGLATPALAQDTPLRVVVVPKVTANGNTRDAGPLEAWVHGALKEAGHRVVDLDASLRAQAFALSDAVAAGQVPEELSVLNADAAWAVQLSCEQDTAGHAQAMGLTYYCTLTRKVVRISQGDTAFAESAEWADIFGANPGQALFGGNVKKRAPDLLASDITTWSADFAPDGPWDADLKVSGLTERSQAKALVAKLEELNGVTGARLATFNTTLSQFLISGEGGDALSELPDSIEADGGLGLRITHVSDRLVHAEVDLGRLHRKKMGVYVVPPDAKPKTEAALIAEQSPSLVRASLANLSWMEVGEIGQSAPKGRHAKVALSRAEGTWLVTSSLVGEDGAEILAASGRDEDPLAALDAAVRALDEGFLAMAADPGKRPALGLPEDLGEGLMKKLVRLETNQLAPVFPSRAREAQELGLGSLSIANDAEVPLTEATLTFEVDGEVLATHKLGEIGPGATRDVAVRLERLPRVDPDSAHTLPLQAVLSYKKNDGYGRAKAHTSLVVHRFNTVDWNAPRSVAAFVDAADPTVRDLASKALSADLPDAPTKFIGRAAAVHAGVWGEPMRYVPDPVQTSFADSIDEVQHPRQTLARAAGDCDDLTVLLASLYEAVGLPTVILTTPGHVLVGVDSGLRAGGELLVGLPKERFVEVDGALFIPVETTALSKDFVTAWTLGAELLGKAESIEAYRTRDAWRSYPTASLADAPDSEVTGREADLTAVFAALPKLEVPKPDKADPPLRQGALSWAGGNRNKGLQISADACEAGIGEACFNIAVMLMATATEETEPVIQDQLEQALTLLPRPVMGMLLDQWGGGMASESDSEEASAEADTRRRLEAVLEKARERQETLEEQGKSPAPVKTDAMAGRRGAPATEEEALAPMFFYTPAAR